MEQLIKGYYELTYIGDDKQYQVYDIATHTIGGVTMRMLMEEVREKKLQIIFDFNNKKLLIAKEQLIKGYCELTYVGDDEQYQVYDITTNTISGDTMHMLMEEVREKNLLIIFYFTKKKVLIAKLPF